MTPVSVVCTGCGTTNLVLPEQVGRVVVCHHCRGEYVAQVATLDPGEPERPLLAGGIFVSHCHDPRDMEVVRGLVAHLRRRGYSVYVDFNTLRGGDSLLRTIAQCIKVSRKFVVVLSGAALKSRWVQTEIEWALIREIRDRMDFIIPFIIDDAGLSGFQEDVRLASKLAVVDLTETCRAGFDRLGEALPAPPAPDETRAPLPEALTSADEEALDGAELRAQATVAFREGRVEESLEMARRAEDAARASGEEVTQIAQALTAQARPLRRMGRFAEALDLYQQSLRVYEERGDHLGRAHTLLGIASIRVERGELDEAARAFTQAAEVFASHGENLWAARAFLNLSQVRERHGQVAEAEAAATRAVEFARRSNLPPEIKAANKRLGSIERRNRRK
ncbi:MAG: toll/interleukin-1 receptor domain-containing protein [Planctomycetes bacterium]|nr:toll/interleukin-1 receptor domain-containing protein [Planctomycetota bacterium]